MSQWPQGQPSITKRLDPWLEGRRMRGDEMVFCDFVLIKVSAVEFVLSLYSFRLPCVFTKEARPRSLLLVKFMVFSNYLSRVILLF